MHDTSANRARARYAGRAGCRGALALGLAALLVAAQLAALDHEIGTVHVTCAEHGEQLDIGHLAAGQAGHAAAPPAAGLRGASGVAAREAHEHCAFATLARHQVTGQAVSVAPVVVPAPVRAIRVPARPAPRTSRRLFRLAPKNSPPRG